VPRTLKTDVLRDLTREELMQKRHDIEEELFNLRLRKRVQEIVNPLRMRTLRRDLARIATILREDELQIHSVAHPEVKK
jgi:large subunit ribosomal protein L29